MRGASFAVFNDGIGAPARVDTGHTVSATGNRRTYEVVINGITGASYYIDGALVAAITRPLTTTPLTPVFLGLGNQRASTTGNSARVYGIAMWRD